MSQHDELIERLRGAESQLLDDALSVRMTSAVSSYYRCLAASVTDAITALSAPSVAPQKDAGDDMTAREQLAAAFRELYDWTVIALPLSRFEGGAPVAIQRAGLIRIGLAANGQKKETCSPQFIELIAGIDRAVELAVRLTSAGPKCCNVSCSETHEIADFIHDVANMLVATDEPLKPAALSSRNPTPAPSPSLAAHAKGEDGR
jgi:hypothetical protein